MDIQWFAHITPQMIYVLCSALVAILIFTEGQYLKKTEGRLPESKFFHISSVIDTLWVFVSIAAMYWMGLESIQMAVPVAYCVYTLSGWVYGSRLLRREGMPKSPDKLVIPKSYISFSQSFAIIFFGLCIAVLAMPWLPIDVL